MAVFRGASSTKQCCKRTTETGVIYYSEEDNVLNPDVSIGQYGLCWRKTLERWSKHQSEGTGDAE